MSDSNEEFVDEIKDAFGIVQKLLKKVEQEPNAVEIDFSLTPKEIAKINSVFKKLTDKYDSLSRNLEFTAEQVIGADYEDYLELLEDVREYDLSEDAIQARIEKLIVENEKTDFIDLTERSNQPAEALRRRVSVEGRTFNQMVEDQEGLN